LTPEQEAQGRSCAHFKPMKIGPNGRCRRFPPAHQSDAPSVWPFVYGSDLCGEYRARQALGEKG
jgi:hypothetical protein